MLKKLLGAFLGGEPPVDEAKETQDERDEEVSLILYGALNKGRRLRDDELQLFYNSPVLSQIAIEIIWKTLAGRDLIEGKDSRDYRHFNLDRGFQSFVGGLSDEDLRARLNSLCNQIFLEINRRVKDGQRDREKEEVERAKKAAAVLTAAAEAAELKRVKGNTLAHMERLAPELGIER